MRPSYRVRFWLPAVPRHSHSLTWIAHTLSQLLGSVTSTDNFLTKKISGIDYFTVLSLILVSIGPYQILKVFLKFSLLTGKKKCSPCNVEKKKQQLQNAIERISSKWTKRLWEERFQHPNKDDISFVLPGCHIYILANNENLSIINIKRKHLKSFFWIQWQNQTVTSYVQVIGCPSKVSPEDKWPLLTF